MRAPVERRKLILKRHFQGSQRCVGPEIWCGLARRDERHKAGFVIGRLHIHASISQCPPLSGPTRRKVPDCFSLRTCHSTPLRVRPREDAMVSIEMPRFTRINSRILSLVLSLVFSLAFSPVFSPAPLRPPSLSCIGISKRLRPGKQRYRALFRCPVPAARDGSRQCALLHPVDIESAF